MADCSDDESEPMSNETQSPTEYLDAESSSMLVGASDNNMRTRFNSSAVN